MCVHSYAICKHDPDIHKMYLHTINEVSRSRLSKVRDTHTDRRDQTQYHVVLADGK